MVQRRRETKMQVEIDGLAITVTRKKMKYLRVAVKPPAGEVRVSAPWHCSACEVEHFIRGHLPWIREQQSYIETLPAPAALTLQSGETLYVGGQELQLQVETRHASRSAFVLGDRLFLNTRSGDDESARLQLLRSFYREQLTKDIPTFIERYEAVLGVQLRQWRIKQMKTRWGTCNIADKRIWLNLALAKYPLVCLEYVVVHELAHLLERGHNARFWNIVSDAMPNWQEAKQVLKQNLYG